MTDPIVHHLLLYDYVENVLDRRGPYRSDHLARIKAEQDAGRVAMAGALGDPASGAAIVFRGVEREFVEDFARTDPYVRAGLVPTWRVERWNLV
jgi:uncharacterized protein YciI